MLASKDRFPTTEWSVVLAAAGSDPDLAAKALDELCRNYWRPLYAYLRRKGRSPAHAEEMVQEFFATRVLTGRVLEGLQPDSKSLFRSSLLRCLKHLEIDDFRHAATQVDGGRLEPVELSDAEPWFEALHASELAAEVAFDRAFTHVLIERAAATLEASYRESGLGAEYGELRCFLPGAGVAPPQKEVATRLGLAEGEVRERVRKLRRKLGEELKREVRTTVGSEEDVEGELRYLLRLVSEHPF